MIVLKACIEKIRKNIVIDKYKNNQLNPNRISEHLSKNRT